MILFSWRTGVCLLAARLVDMRGRCLRLPPPTELHHDSLINREAGYVILQLALRHLAIGISIEDVLGNVSCCYLTAATSRRRDGVEGQVQD